MKRFAERCLAAMQAQKKMPGLTVRAGHFYMVFDAGKVITYYNYNML